MQLQRDYEMGYTTQEFARVLKGNFSSAASQYRCREIAPQRWVISSTKDDLNAELTVTALPDRKLGMFALPVLKASFTITASDPASIDALFDKFFKYFHKGGG